MLTGVVLLLSVAAGAPGGFAWAQDTPESQGMSGVRLGELVADLAAHRTASLLVVRHDRIVTEWHAPVAGRAVKHGTASLAKAIVAGMSLAVALSDGRIALDDRAARYVKAWDKDARKRLITIRQLGSHTAGIEDAEQDDIAHDKLPGWKGDFWARKPVPNDPFTIARDVTPLISAPGAEHHYSNPGIAMLTYTVTASLAGTRLPDIRALLAERVLAPLGVPDAEWSVGYGQTFVVDGLPLVASWGGGSFSPDATARIGRLLLRRGDWQGRRVLPEAALAAVTGDAGTPGDNGQGFWNNAEGRVPALPRDAFWGSGAGHQVLLVVPSLDLIAVRYGQTLDEGDHADALAKHLFTPLAHAITDRPPVPPSPVVTGLTWAPAATIVRKARGCDTWPLTWADDDAMYGTCGDGNGFEPFLPAKMSLALARIDGAASAFTGTNLRAPTIEQTGHGAVGKKASGMLMVGGVLYMWLRNADGQGHESQLAWSADHGRTWTHADWRFAELGAPTFLNYGRNYAGARDGFVYVYSHDNPSAYRPGDRFVLLRVAKDRIRERAAYQFFRGLDQRGQPLWTASIAERGAVFSHTSHCGRSGITYDAGIGRYLWWQQLNTGDADTRSAGGFGVYDAPEPWGPWTTVYFTHAWDVGPGESASFPTKWMSADGKTLHLVFSGDDAFSVRRATISVSAPASGGNARAAR
jgi:hypothetical protein